MGVTVRTELDRSAIERLLTSPSGPVRRAVREVTEDVARAARRRAPVDDGRLRSSIRTAYRTRRRTVTGIVFSDLDYSQYVQRGTGVYGPRGRPIRGRPVMVFPDRQGGGLVFARQVRGQPPQPFMLEALRAASPWPVTALPL